MGITAITTVLAMSNPVTGVAVGVAIAAIAAIGVKFLWDKRHRFSLVIL